MSLPLFPTWLGLFLVLREVMSLFLHQFYAELSLFLPFFLNSIKSTRTANKTTKGAIPLRLRVYYTLLCRKPSTKCGYPVYLFVGGSCAFDLTQEKCRGQRNLQRRGLQAIILGKQQGLHCLIPNSSRYKTPS